jgi:hypothetical protein
MQSLAAMRVKAFIAGPERTVASRSALTAACTFNRRQGAFGPIGLPIARCCTFERLRKTL